MLGKVIQSVRVHIGLVGPLKCELESSIGVVGEIACVYSVADDENLYLSE